MFALNGLPVATCELKNPATGQSWRRAVRQYQHDRDPGAPIFRFKARALVHFAADPDEIHMTTRLAKAGTRFLPFNRGSHPGEVQCGAGNPQHPSGHRTGYLWEEVLARDSFLDILGAFMFVERKDEKVDGADGRARRVTTETVIFPRYHQLAAALVDETKIVVTTLQKFPFVLRGLLRVAGADAPEAASADEQRRAREWEAAIAGRRYAVIVDEAHSSQTGETARELKAILGAAVDEDAEQPADWEDRLNQVMLSRGRQPNLSFFAFTATPKGKTLEVFGRVGESGTHEAFHIYSMRQAIEEGFILDVLTHYTTYETYYRLLKAAVDDPSLPRKRAARALARFMSLHPHNIEQKTQVMVEHFRGSVRHRLAGRAKAMVVTESRLHAVRYYQSFRRYIADHHYDDVRPLVAFSGTVRDPDTGGEYTEPGLNLDVVNGEPISEKRLPERFDSPDYNLLLVANKYQTGFDQPKLHTMYVDKRLDGVQAVQTLSRLNRKIPGKDAPFVLDFRNEAEDIYRAFKPYYDATQLEAPSDPTQLEALKHDLDQTQVYHWSEVEAFAQVFYRPPDQQNPSDHAHMQRHLQPAVDRFRGLPDDEQRTNFRARLSAYVKLYAFLSQILPYTDRDHEMLYSFGRCLLPHLPLSTDTEPVKLTDEVALQYYRLERIHSGAINVAEGDTATVHGPTEVGTGKSTDERAPLSEIIEILNARLGTSFTEEDRLFFQQIKEKACRDEQIIQTAHANPFDKFALGIRHLIERLMIQRMSDNDAIVTRYMEDREFQRAAFPVLAREIFEEVMGEGLSDG